MAERISTGKAAQVCGVTKKTILRLARAGKIPGAAELDTRLWRFDERRLRDWIKRREAACQKVANPISINAAARAPSTLACKSMGATFDEAYERLLGLRR